MHEESSRRQDRRLARRERRIRKSRSTDEESLRLDLDGATVLELITSSGQIEVTADGEPGVAIIHGLRPPRRGGYRRTVRREGKRWIVHPRRGSRSLRVRCPAGMNLTASTRSGQISIQGPLGEVRASSSSGRVEVQDVESLRARSRSGNIEVRDCRGSVKLGIVSGKIVVERAGSVELVGVSGNVELRQIAGKVGALLVSGSVQAQSNGGGVVEIASISGDLRVELPGHLRPAVKTHQMSGTLRNDLPAGDDLKVDLSSVSGDIAIGTA